MLAAFAAAAALFAATPLPDAIPAEKRPPSHRPARDAWAALPEADRVRVLEAYLQRSLPERLVEASRRFLNTPYVISPLGEGHGRDPDPTVRYDAVDCLTFVEQTVALALAHRPEEVTPLLQELRYGREPRYEDRNHLMEAQWLPNNLRKGFLRDVTQDYGGRDTVRVSKRLTPAAWQSNLGKALELPADKRVVGEFALDIIPLDKVVEKAPRIPTGTILVVVREDAPFRVTRITHLGFIIQKEDGRTYLRHAAMSVFQRVVDEELGHFIGRNVKYDKWRVSGVSLYEVHAPSQSPASSAPTP
ncbi:MAG TPA: N-acetylmuramoyl-L-alanine amidase-like domain-containing protein [Longimicrobium sp.]|nr:N-acetylmuramoyl-L-alanine amidase-like domain-containing protein [Longimicrobium sp.]